MLHEPATEVGIEESTHHKTRLGIWMFIVYAIMYFGFVLIGTFYPRLLGIPLLSGLNLAYIYGMGLITLAVVMGLIYNFLCTRLENKLNQAEIQK